MKLTVATCQFPVARSIRANLGYVLRQMRTARDRAMRGVYHSGTLIRDARSDRRTTL